jgi:hypothetical protein
MAILKLYFAGTAGYASTIKKSREELEGNRSSQEGDEVIRLYFTGCQHPEVGGRTTLLGLLDPYLDYGTDRLRSCFETEDGVVLDIQKIRTNFPRSSIIDTSEMPLWNNFEVSEGCHLAHISAIEMYGFSRGAVTTFFAIKKLNDLNIPLRVIANEPVPGDSKKRGCHQFNEGSLLHKSIDLSDCHNLESLIVILGQYAQNLESSQYFRQMVPKVPLTTEAKLWLIPIQYHAGLSIFTEQLLREIFFPRERSARILLESVLVHGLTLCQNELGEQVANVTKVRQELRENLLRGLPDEPSFLPRLAQKSFHFGAIGRLQWAPAIKEMMLLRLQAASLSLIRPDKFSQVRALMALYRHESTFTLLRSHINELNGEADLNIALRDFINEFDAIINSYTLRVDNAYELYITDLNHFHRRVLGFVERRLSKDESDWPSLKQEVLEELESFSGALSSECRSSLSKLLTGLFSDSPLLHRTLIPFLVELDEEGLEDDLSVAHRAPIDARPTTFMAFAKLLFFSSKARRELLFKEFRTFLTELELNSDELSLLSILISEKSMNSLKGIEQVLEEKEVLGQEEGCEEDELEGLSSTNGKQEKDYSPLSLLMDEEGIQARQKLRRLTI